MIGGLLAVIIGTAVLFPALGVFGVGIWFYSKFQGALSMFSSGGIQTASIPTDYKTVFDAASNPQANANHSAQQNWKIRPEFLAAIFVGEWRSIADSGYKTWPPISGPWRPSEKGAQGPFQFMPATWEGYKKFARPNPRNAAGEPNIQDIWDAAFAAADKLAMGGAAGNNTNLAKLQDAASLYNSSCKWEKDPNAPLLKCRNNGGKDFIETAPYVTRVIAAFNAFMASGNDIVTAAQKYLGKPYEKGKTGPNSFDCSGLVTRALIDAGYKINNNRLYTASLPDDRNFQKVNDLQPGDIMLFKGHMVIYMGRTGTNGAEQIIESSISGNVHISNKSAWVDKNMNIWLGNYRAIRK